MDNPVTHSTASMGGSGNSSSEINPDESLESEDKVTEEGSTRRTLTITEEGETLEISLAEHATTADEMDGLHSVDCSTCGDAEMNHAEEIEEILRNMNDKNCRYDWTTLMIRAGITTALYPSQMAQMLMQAGYEPFPPRRSVTLLGRPCLLLPSTGGYLRYIYQVDGVQGIFRGLAPRIGHQLLFTYIFDCARCQLRRMHVNRLISKARERDEANAAAIAAGMDVEEVTQSMIENSEDSDSSVTTGFWDHFRETMHDLSSKLTAIVVSYPLHVVVVRTISHFVGREHCIRPGLLGEIKAIYCDFGLLGFYRGLVPKLLGETCQTLAVGALAFFVSNQAPGVEVRSLLNLSFSILVSAWTYQFSVVSTTMAVNGSCLKVGNPPIQPVYNNWVQCWRDLGKLNLLNRGSSIVCRYYTGPTHFEGGFKVPTGIYFGPNHLPLSKPLLLR